MTTSLKINPYNPPPAIYADIDLSNLSNAGNAHISAMAIPDYKNAKEVDNPNSQLHAWRTVDRDTWVLSHVYISKANAGCAIKIKDENGAPMPVTDNRISAVQIPYPAGIGNAYPSAFIPKNHSYSIQIELHEQTNDGRIESITEVPIKGVNI